MILFYLTSNFKIQPSHFISFSQVPSIECVVANDYDYKAVDYIKQNALLNGVEALVEASCGDASLIMHQHKK